MAVAQRTHKFLPQKPGKENQLIRRGRPPKELTLNEAMAGKLKEGEVRTGFLGEGNIIHKPDYIVQESLSVEEKARKKALQAILSQVIEPNAISNKSSPQMDRRSLVNKLNRSTLDDLLRLCSDRLQRMTSTELQEIATGKEELTEADKAEVQNLYIDVSP
jgi:hypothetical protein